MKKCITVALVLCMACMLIACSKSKDVQAAENAINAIGEVTLESESLIKTAEKLYGILTDSEKSNVSNRLALVEAREEFDKLQAEEQAKQEEQRKQKVYENAKLAYEKLNEAAQLCIDGMDDVYGAWYWGIYKATDATSSTTFSNLAKETPHFTAKELEAVGLSAYTVKSDWQYALLTVELALAARGDYDTVKTKMSEAQTLLQELTTTYDDYTYYPKLKDYYAAVDSYVTFFLEPTGSFNQLADTVNNYETNIRTYQSDVGFLFNK